MKRRTLEQIFLHVLPFCYMSVNSQINMMKKEKDNLECEYS